MHYYKRNLGDYAKKAGRLSMLEHGAYTLLIDACYDRERFPTEQEAIEWTWARSEAEIDAVRFVLSRFFELRDGFYVQTRIEEEILKYQENAATNARIAREREEKRRTKTRTVHEPCTKDGENDTKRHLTNNQEPITKNHSLNTSSPQVATRTTANRFEDFWNTYPNTPRRVAKAKCFQKWKSLHLDDQADEIIKHVTAMKATEQWREGYEPAPLTYINQRRWSDGIPEIQNTPQPQAKKPVDLWWTTDHGVIAKGKELGLNPRPGETMGEFKGRINLKMNEVPA